MAALLVAAAEPSTDPLHVFRCRKFIHLWADYPSGWISRACKNTSDQISIESSGGFIMSRSSLGTSLPSPSIAHVTSNTSGELTRHFLRRNINRRRYVPLFTSILRR